MFSIKDSSVSIDEVDLNFLFKETFIEIGLEPKEWDRVQAELMNRNYPLVDGLELKPGSKCRLWKFINETLEKYFYQAENKMNKLTQIKKLVFAIQLAMNEHSDERKSFKKMLSMTTSYAQKIFFQKSIDCLKLSP